LRAKIEEYQLDVLYVTGFYQLMDEPTHQGFRTITSGSKILADKMQIPMIIETQANRAGEKSRGETDSDVAFGDSLAQDCDGLLRIVRTPEHAENKEVMIAFPALREAEGGAFVVNAIPCTNFKQKHVINDSEGDDELESKGDIT
jgi:hypothetical protein